MNTLNAHDIEEAGIRSVKDGKPFATTTDHGATHRLYERMVEWGWIDSLGRPQSWRYWQRKSTVQTTEEPRTRRVPTERGIGEESFSGRRLAFSR